MDLKKSYTLQSYSAYVDIGPFWFLLGQRHLWATFQHVRHHRSTSPSSEVARHPRTAHTNAAPQRSKTQAHMDKFVRVEKPLSPSLRETSKKRTQPQAAPQEFVPLPSPVDWHFIQSDDATRVDVHALSKDQLEHILRLFDLNPAYGPFVGVDRLLRWQRAEQCGLSPPLLVKRVIDTGIAVSQQHAGRLW
ncbi:DNA polymerase delta subunit 4 [Gracilariopsis chorda]|uniref:DNA polymerase delta subunit 4 n=1 Tax=Gracilariopsis chorda TaxID=448386 RepID=A0A2V3IDZ2_9FLOR|nr:DNA polymerase delta subunit 4 [Gracilariopsis chorda]|eukprot:PXF40309.1 DNA polymerase delta subunit 4 [Gracilariopsis chorda]